MPGGSPFGFVFSTDTSIALWRAAVLRTSRCNTVGATTGRENTAQDAVRTIPVRQLGSRAAAVTP
jgi:hypothetical protein